MQMASDFLRSGCAACDGECSDVLGGDTVESVVSMHIDFPSLHVHVV